MTRRRGSWLWACLAVLGVAACGGGLQGRFATDDGVGRLEFERDGRVYVTFADSTFLGEYELDGERVIIQGPGGNQVCTRSGDELTGFGMTFVKERER